MFTYAARVLSLGEQKGHLLVTSPLCLAIAFYFSSKKSGEIIAKKKINHLTDFIGITDINESVVRKALQDKRVHNFEDGMQYYSALAAHCEVIVTEDEDDFYFSELPVKNCEELILANNGNVADQK